jgi:Asp-tRNA(Asn)/Glu-tRNA(Gln) amidotransferase A subunit family amidase
MADQLIPYRSDEIEASGDLPQDFTVDRRWFMSRMAGLWAAAAAAGAAGGTFLGVTPAGAALSAASAAETYGRGPTTPKDWWDGAYAKTIRPEALADYTEMTISEAAAAFRKKTITPVDLMAAYLDRINQYEAVYQAFLWRRPDSALLDLARQVTINDATTPLAGIATAEKDNYYTAGIPTTAMSPVYQGFVPEYDSTVHARLRQSGAIMIGKAAMGPLASGRARLPDGTATTRNAWTPDDIRYSPSGSSGGTATAVASRLATSGTGTQTGGSITSPANAQNLTAIKPTFGRASVFGIVPLTITHDHPGPLARDAMDAAIMLQSFAGPDANDPRTLGLPAVPNYIKAATVDRSRGKASVRWQTTLGYPPDYLSGASAELRPLREAMLQAMSSVGVVVREVPYPDDWSVLTGNVTSTAGEGTSLFLPFLRKDVRLFADRLTGFLNGQFRSADSYIKAMEARYILLKRTLTQFFGKCDVLLIGTVVDRIGLPMMAFPYGMGKDTTTGLTVPRGATIAAPPFGEERLLALVAAYQAVTDHHLKRPPNPTVTASARAAAEPYKVPADYDASEES